MKSYLSAAFLCAAIFAANGGQAVITSGPNDLTNNAGSTANFSVTAANATSYQWTFKGAAIAGATNPQYIIDNTATNQAGVYAVIVGGSTGTNVTAPATLTVLQGTIVNFQITGFRNSSGRALPASNVLVELFDHDKPATVQNFVHYIRSGAYLEMFFDRLIPGFVLQGGGWWAPSQYKSNSVPPLSVGNIYQYFVQNLNALPVQVDSEFYMGPQVSNLKGTLAMALPPGEVDGAANDFFFNLADNTNLDATNTGSGPFTVFGRVLSGANVLDYFNNTNEFSKPSFTGSGSNNIFTNGIFDLAYFTNASSFNDLPLNYHGTNSPANTNLFFINFTFPNAKAQPLIVTNPPTVAISFPVVNSVVTNGTPLTIRGTARAAMGNTARSLAGAVVKVPASEQGDDGLALVYCTVTAGGNDIGTAIATGTTNWSASFGVLPPGAYDILVDAVDGAGNEGPPAPAYFLKQHMIVSAVGASGVGSVSASNNATGGVVNDAIGAALLQGFTYTFAAIPGAGQSFLNWTVGANVYTNPTVTYTMSSNLFVTANFTGRIAFSYPPLGGNTTNGDFAIQGGIYGQAGLPLTLQCQLFTFPYTNQPPLKTMLATNSISWSFPVTNLPLGHYFVRVTATDTAANATAITNDFTAGLPVTVFANGNGRGTITASFSPTKLVEGRTYYAAEGKAYSLNAAPASGSVFDSWFNGSSYTNNETCKFILTPDLASFTATFVSNDFPATVSSPILITNPTPGGKLATQSFTLAGTINPALTNPVVTYQLFCDSSSATPPGTNVTITPGSRVTKPAWSVGLSNLPPGHYTVVATVSDILGRSHLVSENFQILARLTLQMTPPESGRLASNWTASYIPVGADCILTAMTNGGRVFAYWSGSPGSNASNPLKFTATTNWTITANFASNYFYNAAGSYRGIFYPTDQNVSASNSGYYTLILTSNGAAGIKVDFPAFTNAGSWAFPLYQPSGFVSYSVYWNDQHGNFVSNSVNLDLTNGVLDGYVANARFYAPLTAFRSATELTAASPVLPGTNVFSIPGDHAATGSQPGGDGYASFKLSASGAATLIGYLADNTSFSQSTQVATNYLVTNGVWPFYASLYGGKGVILGWMTNTSPTNFMGQLAWSKPAKSGAYYANGFVLLTNASSAHYIPPSEGTRYKIAFGGATLTNGLTNTLTVASSGLFTVDPGQTNKLTLTFTTSGARTGALSGSFSYPSSKTTHKFYGAFINPAQGGSGYFLDTDSQTGWFEITEMP